MSLGQLRSYFECIPQFPFIFQYSIRKNIDPFNMFTDEEIKKALKDVKMLDIVESVHHF
jgi:ABC-type multidrug transport system fused ATPase/permease subunit